MNCFVDTPFQIHSEILQVNVVGLGDILKSAKSLQQATDTVRVVISKHGKRLWPSFQNNFNCKLCLEELRVHCPQDTGFPRFRLCAGANNT
jgi:hypothetical protein